jgi:hypothetical protein
MSDNNSFGSAGTAVAEPPVDESIATSRGLSPKLLAAVVGGVLVVALGAYFLLFSGGGSDDAATGAVPHSTALAPAGSKAPSASAKPVTSTAPKTVSGPVRDPFAPLIVPVTAPTGAAGTSTGTGATSGSTSTTALPSGLVETVTLVKLNATAVTADVTVNGVKYSGVARGAVFAKYFSLDIITGSTQAQFLFGDSTLLLTVGHSVTVRT